MKQLVFELLVLANCLLQVSSQAPDPNDFCFGCQSRRNHKDLYANPDNCHTYFQCFYFEDDTAIGILRNCPPFTFWHDEILQCLPEGTTPCRDFCQNSNLNTGDCYADATSCSTYFVCDNTASVQFCCPQGTRFNATRCGCDTDDTCVDICVQPTRPPTTKRPPISDGVSCVDPNGTTLRPVFGNPSQFLIVSPNDPPEIFTMNCAPGTLFSLDLCGCFLFSDDVQPVSTKLPPTDIDSCVDPYGNTLRPVPDTPGQYFVITPDNPPEVLIMDCPRGTMFSLDLCMCYTFPEDDVQRFSANTQCSLYLPFDYDFTDHSINRFSVFKYGNVGLSRKPRGSGAALFINGGRLEIPGLKTFSPGKAASFCFLYYCSNPTNCSQGGILSNRKSSDPNAEFSFFYASLAGGNNATAGVSTKQGQAILNFVAEPWFSVSYYYTQICVVYDGTTVSVIENTRPKSQFTVAQKPLTGDVTVGTCPFVVGTDQIFGDFSGYVDDVLVCERALTQFEVMSHFAGPPSMQKAGLIPTEITFPSYKSVKPQPSPHGACGHNKYWNAGEQMQPILGIYGGFNAQPDEFPWSVMLISPNSPKVCSGTVLSEGYVITEGRCCASWLNASDGGVSSVTLYYGVGETGYPDFFPPNTAIPPPAQFAFKTGAATLIPNPNLTNDVWSLDVVPYDFCLVKVANPVKFNSWKIQPICLPTSCDDTCQSGDADLLSGYGLLSGGWYQWNFLAKRDQFNVVPVLSDDECITALQRYSPLSPADFSTIFCAGYVKNGTNVGSGMGDDGTSLACYKKGYFSLDGVLSIQFGINPYYPMIYAKVCVVLDWIRSYIG